MVVPGDGQLAVRLTRARQAADLTQSRLAILARTTQGQVSCYERGVAVPTEVTLLRLAKALGVTKDWLLWGRGETASPVLDDPLVAAARGLNQQLDDVLRDLREARRQVQGRGR